jgi:hypothetical protein
MSGPPDHKFERLLKKWAAPLRLSPFLSLRGLTLRSWLAPPSGMARVRWSAIGRGYVKQ